MRAADSELIPIKFEVAVCLVLLIFGVFFLMSYTGRILEGRESASWPTVRGRVSKSEVQRKLIHSRLLNGRRGRRRRYRYLHQFQYNYTVNGQKFSNDRIDTYDKMQFTSSLGANGQRSDYPVASDVVVSYRPDDPSNSLLVTGFSFGTVALWLLGQAMLVTSGGLTWLRRKDWLREWRRKG